jgi:hypothetical protein
MISRPAIDPATSTLPVMNQLIANVSSVPKVRQLTAFRTDLACVSAPRNRTTGCASPLPLATAYHANPFARGAARHARDAKIAQPPMDRLRDYVHFGPRNQTNSLIGLSNSDTSRTTGVVAGFGRELKA